MLLYGKMKIEGTDNMASACIIVEGMQRCYYVFKRAHEDMTLEAAQDEIVKKIEKRHPNIAKSMKVKPVTDKFYNFELDIARGSVEVIKISYSFDLPILEVDFEGVAYNGIIGGTYKPTELFLIKNKIMGPCWLEISDFKVSRQKELTHCDIEARVESRYDVQTIGQIMEVPKFKAVSLSLIREKDGNGNIKVIAGLYTTNYDVESVQQTVTTTPFAFVVVSDQLKDKDKREIIERAFGRNITFSVNDFAMIQAFLQNLVRMDPDLIIGHDANNIFFEALLARCEALKIDMQSNLSRSKRDSNQMRRDLKTFGIKKIRQATFGRLVCDTHLSSMEIIRETNYELDYLAEKHLNENNIYGFRGTSQDPLEETMKTIDQAFMNAHLSLSLC